MKCYAVILALLAFTVNAENLDDLYFSADNPVLSEQERAALAIAERWQKGEGNGDIRVFTGRGGAIQYVYGAQAPSVVCAVIAAVRQQIDAALQEDPSAAFEARLEQIRGLNGGGAATAAAPITAPAPAAPASPPGGNSIAEFAGGGGDRWQLDTSLRPPRSAYELRAGYVAPAILISGINSALPGQIVAQVSRDVYDTATGRHVLIPQGSRLVGTYSSEVNYGQSRVLIAWQRIVFPDARAVDIGAMPGADSAGYAGFQDQVNNHYFRLFGSAFLMSAITAGIAMSQDNAAGRAGGNRQRASDAMSEALGQQLGQVTAQMIARNLNIAPTIEIRPGYRFNVIVTKDLAFARPYAAFDYTGETP